MSCTSEWEDLDDRTSHRDKRANSSPKSGKQATQPLIVSEDVTGWLNSVGTLKYDGNADFTLPSIEEDAGEKRFYRKQKAGEFSASAKGSPNFEDSTAGAERTDSSDFETDDSTKRKGFFKGLFQKKTKPVYGVDRKWCGVTVIGKTLKANVS
jgi:hypothetical protein